MGMVWVRSRAWIRQGLRLGRFRSRDRIKFCAKVSFVLK
jgi:hypothetical protein